MMNWTREQLSFHDMQRLLSRLTQHVKAFHGLSMGEVSDLLSNAEKCSFAPGGVIVKEGTIGQHMYIILSGTARVTKTGRGGIVELASLEPADSFGEMALVDNEARSATVVADADCVLVRINDLMISSKPDIGIKVYRNIAKVVSSRLRAADEYLAWRL